MLRCILLCSILRYNTHMATIKPFSALSVQQVYADQLLSVKTAGQADHRSLLEKKLSQQSGSGFKEINLNLQQMLSKGDLVRRDQACCYIYEITEGHQVSTGVWTITDLADFDRRLIGIGEAAAPLCPWQLDYRDTVGLEGAPVLISYPRRADIKTLSEEVKRSAPFILYYANKVFHRIWAVYDLNLIQRFITAFSTLKNVFLADGQQRVAAALACRRHWPEHSDFNFISSVYLSSDQMKVTATHRVIIPADSDERDRAFHAIKKYFFVRRSPRNQPVLPVHVQDFGLCIDRKWYYMSYKRKETNNRPDVCLLQDLVLEPSFGIVRQQINQRLLLFSGTDALDQIQACLSAVPLAIAFTLAAMTVNQLSEASREGSVLPGKSAWIEPRMPFGLLLRKLRQEEAFSC